MYKIDYQKAAIVGALLLALIALYVALSATTAPAPVVNVPPVASSQSFACGAGTMCVTANGRVVDILSGGTFNINSGAVFTVGGLTQYAISYFSADVTNGSMVTHGLPGAPTYPNCMAYNAGFITQTVQISAANATSVTFRVFDAAGLPWTGAQVAARCSAVYVP
ncbi:MAG: hypothetical protein IPO08_20385 [Xanthomonadales bacterium]|nr:hypothetical protein [Xanthomonadales bacterium]